MRDANLPGTEPLSDQEIELLTGYLARIEAPGSMNVEELDGFFSALIAGPELVPPSEYLPFVLGSQAESDSDKTLPFEDLNDINAMLGLTMRHWNTIARTLNEGEVYLPLILEGKPDERLPEGHRWARGFMRGVAMRRNAWVELITDEDEGGAILPIALLAGEVDPDWLTKPVDSEKHSEFLALMAAGFHRIYEYFEPHRRENAMLDDGAEAVTVRRDGAKIGRNEPCPCGSGKKFKRCCGKAGAGSPSVH